MSYTHDNDNIFSFKYDELKLFIEVCYEFDLCFAEYFQKQT